MDVGTGIASRRTKGRGGSRMGIIAGFAGNL